jgi:Reverse transcriptase (RNA-dependent DNA polymerase)
LDENGHAVRNKASLVAQGYKQQDGIDFEKIFTLVVHLEFIRILLAYAAHRGLSYFKLMLKVFFF